MKKVYWVSATAFTCGIETENGIIVKTAPILSRFKGQKVETLKYWLEKTFSKLQVEEVEEGNV